MKESQSEQKLRFERLSGGLKKMSLRGCGTMKRCDLVVVVAFWEKVCHRVGLKISYAHTLPYREKSSSPVP